MELVLRILLSMTCEGEMPLGGMFPLQSTHVNKHVFSPHLRPVAIRAYRGVLHCLSRGHIVLPAMPRTSYHLALQQPFSQGPPSVQTRVIYGINGSADVRERNRLAFDMQLPHRSRRHLTHFHRPNKSHLLVSVLSAPSLQTLR